MAKRSKAQEDALKALGNPKVTAEYDDGSIDFEFEGSKLAMGPNGSVMTPAEYMTKVYRPWQAKKKKEPKKKEKAPAWSYPSYSSKTPCERAPALCTPRIIRHVAWDADDTIWDIKPYGIASNISGELTLLDPDTVVEERPPYKPPSQPILQPTFTPHDEGLRFDYGYRYGSKLGYPQGEPEDFFIQQIDTDIEKGTTKPQKSVDDDGDVENQDPLGKEIAVILDVRYDGWQEGIGMQFTDIQDTGATFYADSYESAKDKLKAKRELFKAAEKPSETALEVNQIMTELTEELTEQDKEFLGLVGKEVTLIPTSATPPKKPGKKAKTAFHEPSKVYIKLMPGYRDLLDTLKEQGVTNSIISLNTKGTVSRIIDKFGLTDHYLEIRDSWDNKGKVFNEQMKTFGYKPQEAMFVDNAQSHVEDVAKSGAVPLVYGKDIKEVAQIVNYMTNA